MPDPDSQTTALTPQQDKIIADFAETCPVAPLRAAWEVAADRKPADEPVEGNEAPQETVEPNTPEAELVPQGIKINLANQEPTGRARRIADQIGLDAEMTERLYHILEYEMKKELLLSSWQALREHDEAAHWSDNLKGMTDFAQALIANHEIGRIKTSIENAYPILNEVWNWASQKRFYPVAGKVREAMHALESINR